MYLICDCDNFYASCERVFNPSLNGVPVVVLSNNDGCIIARSKEAKTLGIKMGTPLYQVRDFLENNNVAVFSSNYNLYGDMSRRVMMLLSEYSPKFWQYSIDEMFLDLDGVVEPSRLEDYGMEIRQRVTKGTGIPVTIGIAPTKTLAKMASKYGKNYAGYNHVCIIDTEEKRIKALEKFPVEDVWGIGHRSMNKLSYYSISTAADYASRKESWINKYFHLPGVRTWKELQGIDCISIDELPHKESICTSRSFAGQGLSELSGVEEAVANFASMCAKKLREQRCTCRCITVFAHTSRFRLDLPQNYIYASLTLPVATNSSQEIVNVALGLLRRDWREGNYLYKKAGVVVWGISPDRVVQPDMFDVVDRERQNLLTKAIDEINRKNGYNMVKLAVQGGTNKWHLKCELKSRQFTTNIDDIIRVK